MMAAKIPVARIVRIKIAILFPLLLVMVIGCVSETWRFGSVNGVRVMIAVMIGVTSAIMIAAVLVNAAA